MTIEINENNYQIVKAQILAIKEQLEQEAIRNYDAIKAIEKRQEKIKRQWSSFTEKLNKIGEFELESEYRFLEEIERNCKRCGKLYDKRKGSEDLCPACFTSNS